MFFIFNQGEAEADSRLVRQFKQKLVELDEYHKTVSPESAPLIGEVKTSVQNAFVAYELGVQSVQTWAEIAIPSVSAYTKQLASGGEVSSLKKNLVDLIVEGLGKMNAAQQPIDENFAKLREEARKSTESHQKAFKIVDYARVELKMESMSINSLKVQTEEANKFLSMDNVPQLRDMVMESAQKLIAKCNEYLKRHASL